jgi:hypothetical protein
MRPFRYQSVLLSAIVVAAACGESDPRLAGIHSGLSRDSVMRILSVDSASPGFVHSRERYLVSGQRWEVLFYDAMGRPASATVESSELVPIVLHEDTVSGTGWASWESLADANGLARSRPSPSK